MGIGENTANRKKSGGMNIGTSSILVTFVLLCLVTFAALSYMSARSDFRLSRQAADRTTAYYEANRMGEVYLANIEAILVREANGSLNEEEYLSGIADAFSDNTDISVEREGGDVYISYQITISKAQDLTVKLRALYPDNNDGRMFDIVKWCTRTNSEYINELKKNDSKENSPGLMF